jgi:hypothetical protein
MTNTWSVMGIVGAFVLAGVARAEGPAGDGAAKKPAAATAAKPSTEKPAEGTPPAGPPKPGPETKALEPFFKTMSWTGKAEPGAFGPGSPATETRGGQKCHWVLDNFWVTCEITDTAGSGKTAMTFKGHGFAGWDLNHRSYRMLFVDNMGGSSVMEGKLEGKKLVFETPTEVPMMGTPMKFRLTFDHTDPKRMTMTDERAVKGGEFKKFEEVVYKTTK